MAIVRIDRRGRITIPSALRRELGLREGGRLLVRARDGEMMLRPVHSIFALRGSVPVDGRQDYVWLMARLDYARSGGRFTREDLNAR